MRALITGASQGIGRATAMRLAADGADVAVHYRTHEKEARRLVEEIHGKGRAAFALRADLSDPDAVPMLARGVRAKWDSLDLIVHNAGEYPRRKFTELSPKEFESCFRPLVFAPAALTRELLPLLQRSGAGRIVFISSVLAYTGSTHGAHYAAAKAALLGLARSLARELAPKITVNVVAPGPVDTAILADDTPEMRAARIAQLPAGRVGTAEDVAAAVAFLASPEASFVTGATLHVNGGTHFG